MGVSGMGWWVWSVVIGHRTLLKWLTHCYGGSKLGTGCKQCIITLTRHISFSMAELSPSTRQDK